MTSQRHRDAQREHTFGMSALPREMGSVAMAVCDGLFGKQSTLEETYPTSSMMQPDQRSSHLHSPVEHTTYTSLCGQCVCVCGQCVCGLCVCVCVCMYRWGSSSCQKRCQCFVPETGPGLWPSHLSCHTDRGREEKINKERKQRENKFLNLCLKEMVIVVHFHPEAGLTSLTPPPLVREQTPPI